MMTDEPQSTTTKPATTIDDSLYSRQLYVYGHEAQARLIDSSICLIGLKGLGIEVAKNLILAGVGRLTLIDDSIARVIDQNSQFYINDTHINQTKLSDASINQLKELNPYVHVDCAYGQPIDVIQANKFSAVITTNQTIKQSIAINEYCRANSIKFIYASTKGLIGSVMVDVINQSINDATGEPLQRGLISHITNDINGIVTTHETRHGLSDGDQVTFEEIDGMIELNDPSVKRTVKVVGPFSFSIGDTSTFHPYTGNRGYFQQTNVPINVTHQSIEQQIKQPNFMVEFSIERQLHVVNQSIDQWREQNDGSFPNPNDWKDSNAILSIAQSIAQEQNVTLENTDLLLRLIRVSSADLSPVAALIGGLSSQEVIKAVTGKFTPLNQVYYFDGSHLLSASDDQKWRELSDYQIQWPPSSSSSRYDWQISVFGRSTQSKLAESHYFIVGAGAIGCELLKAAALMGIGKVTVTDMDTIEKSNLNRQFLFRSHDVGQLKSVVAAREAERINPAIKVHAQELRVGQQTEDIYNDEFWSSLSGALTALDNIEARLYVDQRCVYYQKPMIDSGTLGSKGSVQVVVPFLTENYGASRDPPEESIPICTLKNFPHQIEHTIQWARDGFEGLFNTQPLEANNFLSQRQKYLDELATKPVDRVGTLQSLHSVLIDERPADFQACLAWARCQFEVEYNHKIAQLLHVFPPDAKTSEGAPFWSATKRQPTSIMFDINDPMHFDYVVNAARLRAVVYGINASSCDEPTVKQAINQTKLPQLQLASTKIATSDAEAKQMDEERKLQQEDDEQKQMIDKLTADLLALPVSAPKLSCIEFDKDNDANHHMAYVTAASNLRASNYRIKPEGLHRTKQIAGKIIPAIATTTALVTGLVTMELLKLVMKFDKLEQYRNSSINLALPLVTHSDPIGVQHVVAKLPKGEWKWSQWDRMDIDEGRDLTLQELIDLMQSRYELEVTMLSQGAAMVYMSFGFNAAKKNKEKLNKPVSQVIQEVSKKPLNHANKYIILEACVNDADGEDIEIPYIRYKWQH